MRAKKVRQQRQEILQSKRMAKVRRDNLEERWAKASQAAIDAHEATLAFARQYGDPKNLKEIADAFLDDRVAAAQLFNLLDAETHRLIEAGRVAADAVHVTGLAAAMASIAANQKLAQILQAKHDFKEWEVHCEEEHEDTAT